MIRPAAVLLAALTLAAASANQLGADSAAPQQAVCIVNQSTNVTDAQLANALPAFQAAVDFDFGPAWNARASLELTPAGTPPPPGCWVITLLDSLDQFAAGYHDEGPNGVPFAHVQADPDWSIVLTHELFEMLADPHGNRYASAWYPAQPPTKVYILEVCDPVEDDAMAYTRAGADGTPVAISDFVLENWYSARTHGPMDFQRHLVSAHTAGKGGMYWVLVNGVWKPVVR